MYEYLNDLNQILADDYVHVFEPMSKLVYFQIVSELCNSVETILRRLNDGGQSDKDFSRRCRALETPDYTTYFVDGLPAFYTRIWIEDRALQWELRPGPAPNLVIRDEREQLAESHG